MSSWQVDLREAVRHVTGPDPDHASVVSWLERAAADGWPTTRHEEVTSILRPLLEVPYGSNLAELERLVDWLVERGYAECLADLAAGGIFNVGNAAFRGLGRLGPSASPAILRAIEMRVDADPGVFISGIEEALHVGASPQAVLRALVRNPGGSAMAWPAAHVLDSLPAADARAVFLELSPPDRERVLDVLANHLAQAAVRDAARAFAEPPWDPHRWFALADWAQAAIAGAHLTRATANPSFGLRVSAYADRELRRRHGQISGPFTLPPRFDVTDYRPVLGLALREPLIFEEVDVVRFDYLLAYARVDDEPVAEVVPHLAALVETEATWSSTRARLASVEQSLARARRGLEREREEREDHEGPRATETTLFEVPEEEGAGEEDDPRTVERLSARAAELQGAADRLLPGLREGSARVVEALSGRTVTWERVEPEALLGEFQPFTRTVTLYPAMIRLLARHPLLAPVASEDALVDCLSEIALIHEAAHAYVVLGESCDHGYWRAYRSAPHRIHEGLATACTQRMVTRLGDPLVEWVWSTLRALLPDDYTTAEQALAAGSGERLRRVVLEFRKPYLPPTAFEAMPALLSSLHAAAHIVLEILGKDTYETLRESIDEALLRLQSTPDERAGAALASLVGALRRIPSTLWRAVATRAEIAWPSSRELAKWERQALLHGPAVGSSSLRLRLAWVTDSPGESSAVGQGDHSNIPAIGLPSYDDLVHDAHRVGLAPPPEVLQLRGQEPKGTR